VPLNLGLGFRGVLLIRRTSLRHIYLSNQQKSNRAGVFCPLKE
jgi:hypothetical protein